MANYLYNGMELPALPNWDKALYPYVYISNGFSGIGRKFVCFQNIEYGVTDSGYYCLVVPAGTGMSGLYSDGQWNEPIVTTTDTRITIPNDAFVWANFDVLNADGTLYLAASEPVPILEIQIPKGVDRYSYIVGFNLGLAGMAYPYSAPTPIAYLYNGIRLPALPEWDRGMYPYAVIVHTGADYKLCLKKSAYTVFTSGDYVGINPMNYPKYKLVDGVWESFTQITAFYSSPIWSNHDLYYQDGEELAGTLYLAASDPVPVYE